MAISDQRMTALEIVNEVRKKSKLNPVTSLNEDSDAVTLLGYLNDVVSEVADYGDWQELLREVTVTVQSSVSDYSIPTSAVTVVHHIHEVVYSGRPAEMRMETLDTIRRLGRIRTFGQPTQWGIVGVDGNGNPSFRVTPIPTTAYASGFNFNCLVYEKPVFITTAQTGNYPPFPGKLMVQGLLVKKILDESDGEPTSRYATAKQVYDDMLYESFNRYNGDSGSYTYFRPSRGRR